MAQLLQRFGMTASEFHLPICRTFSKGSIARTNLAPENRGEPGLACRSRNGLQKRIRARFQSPAVSGKDRYFEFKFLCLTMGTRATVQRTIGGALSTRWHRHQQAEKLMRTKRQNSFQRSRWRVGWISRKHLDSGQGRT